MFRCDILHTKIKTLDLGGGFIIIVRVVVISAELSTIPVSYQLQDGLSPDDAPVVEIVWAEFDGHFIARAEVDSVPAHVSAGIDVDFVVLVV